MHSGRRWGIAEHALCLRQALHACFIQQKTHPPPTSHPQRAIWGRGVGLLGPLCLSHLRMASILSLSLLGFSKSVSKDAQYTFCSAGMEVKAGACVRPAGSTSFSDHCPGSSHTHSYPTSERLKHQPHWGPSKRRHT